MVSIRSRGFPHNVFNVVLMSHQAIATGKLALLWRIGAARFLAEKGFGVLIYMLPAKHRALVLQNQQTASHRIVVPRPKCDRLEEHICGTCYKKHNAEEAGDRLTQKKNFDQIR